MLELGCGTGRISLPLARAGVVGRGHRSVGADARRAAERRRSVAQTTGRSAAGSACNWFAATFARCRFARQTFCDGPRAVRHPAVARCATATSPRRSSRSPRVLAPGGLFGVDLVPDVPNWREYSNRIQLRGRAAGGAHLTLVESVRQDPRRHLTIFEQAYVERAAAN